MQISRDAQITIQCFFRNKGQSLSLGNKDNILSERTRLAIEELIDKKICDYTFNKKNNHEEVLCIHSNSRSLFGNPMNEDEEFPIFGGLEFKPIIITE